MRAAAAEMLRQNGRCLAGPPGVSVESKTSLMERTTMAAKKARKGGAKKAAKRGGAKKGGAKKARKAAKKR
jgi:hypothetical protein